MFPLVKVLKNKKKALTFVLLAIWLTITLFLLNNYLSSKKVTDSQKEIQSLKKILSKSIDFAGIEPAFATVTDAEVLIKADPFYKRAKNGDKVVVWEEKAFLYRPSTKKIIDLGVILK